MAPVQQEKIATSVEQLNQLAKQLPNVNPKTDIKKYFIAAEKLLQTAEQFKALNDKERTYLHYMKFVSFHVEYIPKHPKYNDPTIVNIKNQAKLKCDQILDQLPALIAELRNMYMSNTLENLDTISTKLSDTILKPENPKTEAPVVENKEKTNKDNSIEELYQLQTSYLPLSSEGVYNENISFSNLTAMLPKVQEPKEKIHYPKKKSTGNYPNLPQDVEAPVKYISFEEQQRLNRENEVRLQRELEEREKLERIKIEQERLEIERLDYERQENERLAKQEREHALEEQKLKLEEQKLQIQQQQQQLQLLQMQPQITQGGMHRSMVLPPMYFPQTFQQQIQPTMPPQQFFHPGVPGTMNQPIMANPGMPVLPGSQVLDPNTVINKPVQTEKNIPSTTGDVSGQKRKMIVFGEMFKDFLKKAEKNTKNSIETCGVLAGILKDNVYIVNTLIIPKQNGTSDTVTTVDEEEVLSIQIEQELISLGWIHTHPTQECFLSSVDLHTHACYQGMLPEAIAVVLAPTYSPNLGVFSLTDPPGLQIIKNCTLKGFHTHEKKASALYKNCDHVDLRWKDKSYQVIDIRK